MEPVPLDPRSWLSLSRAAAVIDGCRGRGAIIVWGHDDLDGTTSAAIILRSLRGLGCRAEYYIPPRSALRYGLDPEVFRNFPARGVSALLTVDCGVKDSAEAAEALKMGMAVVITDHHEPPSEMPPGFLAVNPKITEEPRPTPELAGCGVALYLAAALSGRLGAGWLEEDHESLAWAALGTISDRSSLVGENRAIVRKGLPALAENPVFQRVAETAGFDFSAGLSPEVLRQTMVPLLNMAESSGFRHETVELLQGGFNAERVAELRRNQLARAADLERRLALLKDRLDPSLSYVMAVDESLPPGMAGPLASRLRDETGKPAMVVARKDGFLSGECRGFLPFDFVEFLDSMSSLFVQYGGHKQAAGFTVSPGAEDDFFRLSRQAFASRKAICCQIPDREENPEYVFQSLSDVSGIAHELAERAPFGPGNPMPKALIRQSSFPEQARDHRGPLILEEILFSKSGGRRLGPMTVRLDVTHTGTVLIN